MKVVALAGGVGAARFLSGLVEVVPAEDLTVVVNTGDDFRWMGLCVCPDLDTVTYTLAGLANPDTGWGVREDTFRCLERLQRLGGEAWFRIGDLDLATHLIRTHLLQQGLTLSEITAEICRRNGIRSRILPMSDSPVPTQVHTDEGLLAFQDYFVRRKCEPRVIRLVYKNVEEAQAAPGVLDDLASAQAIVLCPSNPFISVGPILALPGLHEAIRNSRATVVAVSPIVGNRAFKGPTAVMLEQLGHEVSAAAVAAMYADILDGFVLDEKDAALRDRITGLGLVVRTAETFMNTAQASRNLARVVLEMLP